jgi:putative FmdB family regulatory protein
MATYDYSCGVCGKPVIITRSITDPEGFYSCDTCNEPLKRVYSRVGVTFNGDGFYSTDNRKV